MPVTCVEFLPTQHSRQAEPNDVTELFNSFGEDSLLLHTYTELQS